MADEYVEITREDIAHALDDIAQWVNGVKAAVLMLEAGTLLKLPASKQPPLMPKRLAMGACMPLPDLAGEIRQKKQS